MKCQHPVIHSLSTGAAIFNHPVRISCIQILQPAVNGLDMLSQSLSHTVRIKIGADSRGYVVIDL